MNWQSHVERNSIENKKRVKVNVALNHVNKKPVVGRQFFVPLPFSDNALKLE